MVRREITVENSIGIEKTLKLMRLIELENIKNHFFIFWVLNKFKNIPLGKIPFAVWNYVSKNFRYEDDPTDEQLISPKIQIQENIYAGDCDDFALFVKTCLSVFNIPSSYLLAGDASGFSHILVILNDGTLLDGTNNKFNFLDQKKYTHLQKV